MTSQLSVLVAAAIPLEEALRAVSRQSEKAHVQNLLSQYVQKYWKDIHWHKVCSSQGVFLTLYCYCCRR
jgi:general secretion pathway protein F